MIQSDQVSLSTFRSEEELEWISEILRAQLAEPYSIFTYIYFLKNWPQLTIMAYRGKQPIGCIIGSIDNVDPRKAYIAMLVVVKQYRRLKVGKKLFDQFYLRVQNSIDKIVLQTECINVAALKFYTKLNFIKTRKMNNYYLSGNDAFRLRLLVPHHKNTFQQQPISNKSTQSTLENIKQKQTIHAVNCVTNEVQKLILTGY